MTLLQLGGMLPLIERPQFASNVYTGIQATGPGSGTLSAWSELDASLATDVYGLVVGQAIATAASGQVSSAQFDIGIGAASSEIMVVERVGFGYSAGSQFCQITAQFPGHTWFFPLFIPAGTRLAFRIRDTRNGIARSFCVDYVGRLGMWHFPVTSKIDSIGLHGTATTCRGTDVAQGLSNAAGAWTELVASSAHDYSGFSYAVQGAGDNSVQDGTCTFDVGTGSAGNEVALPGCTNVTFATSSLERIDHLPPLAWLPLTAPVAAGSRIVVRSSTSQGIAQSVDVALYGTVA